jgi:hypothetical protein
MQGRCPYLAVTAMVAAWCAACREKPIPRPDPSAASAAPTQSTALSLAAEHYKATLEREQKAATKFVSWVGEHRTKPHKIPETEPDCETRGASAGQCEAAVRVDDDPIRHFTARYYKSKPADARFTTHFAAPVTCDGIGADQILSWPEGPGISGAAGEHCKYTSARFASLMGLSVVIELNKGPRGEPNTGVHIFAEGYALRDASFYEALETHTARAR